MKNRFLILAAVAAAVASAIGMASAAPKAPNVTVEGSGVQNLYSARTSSVSSHTASGWMLGWNVTAIGGTADFQIKHSTVAGGDLNVNASSTIYVLSGQSVNDSARGMVRNPLILITRIDADTTVYIDIAILGERGDGI